MKRNLLIALSMLCVLTAIAGGTRIFKNKTANNAVVVANNTTADYENICMALDCLDSQLLVAMEENEDFAFGTVANEIGALRTQVEIAKANGSLNNDEFFAAMEMIQSKMN